MDIVGLCLEAGAAKAGELAVDRLVFQPSLRALCAQNACGLYGRNYTCPPAVGEIERLIEDLRRFPRAVIWQNIYPLEDSYDFEGMMRAKAEHNAMTLDIARRVYAGLGRARARVLGAGGCALCPACALLTEEPCRRPEEALSSLEAYGINVSKIGEVTDMKYINGPNTVTYFSGVFFHPPCQEEGNDCK